MQFKIPKLSFSWGRKNAVTTADLYKELLSRASTKSGVAITTKTALQASVAICCARVIAEGLAQVPFKLYKTRAAGGMDVAGDHAISELISLKPNDFQTSFEFREQMGLHLAFKGRFYAYKVRGLRGEILELLPYEPDMVRLVRDGWEVSYEVLTTKGVILKVPAEDMWHVKGISWDGFNGLEGIKLAREAIGLALATEEHGSRMFSNGAKVGGVLSTEKTLDAEQLKLLKSSWVETQEGTENAYKTAVMFGGLTWSPMAMTGVDSQHLEQRRFQVEEVCRFFRVLPIMVMQSDKAATYASSEQMFLAHVVHTLMPWYSRIEQSATVNLLTAAERKLGYYTKFTVQALLRGASAARAEFYAKALGAGGTQPYMTVDEVREFEEMNPMGGEYSKIGKANYGTAPTEKPKGEEDEIV